VRNVRARASVILATVDHDESGSQANVEPSDGTDCFIPPFGHNIVGTRSYEGGVYVGCSFRAARAALPGGAAGGDPTRRTVPACDEDVSAGDVRSAMIAIVTLAQSPRRTTRRCSSRGAGICVAVSLQANLITKKRIVRVPGSAHYPGHMLRSVARGIHEMSAGPVG
jgi:hypothetical protein